MTQILSLTGIFLMVGLSATAQTVYVSTTGDDCRSGHSRAESVATVERAVAIAECDPAPAIAIDIAEGVYRLANPIVIRRDSLTLHGRGRGETVLSGAMTLPRFKVLTPDRWIVKLPAIISGSDIQQLFVGGRRATMARTPNAGEAMWRTPGVSQTVIDSVPSRGAQRKGLAVHTMTLPPDAYGVMSRLHGAVENVRVTFLHAWDMTRRYVETFSSVDSTLHVVGNLMKPWNAIDRESQFFLEGDPSMVDEPGEWCYDRSTNTIIYYPRAGEQPDSVVAEIPLLE